MQDKASILGVLAASVAFLVLGLRPYITPHAPIPAGGLKETIAQANMVPAPAKLSLIETGAFIDTENSVAISMGRSSSVDNTYAPIHAPGSTEVLAIVTGSENEWRNANIRPLPFNNQANAAAVASASDAVLCVQPVPLIVRRHLEEKKMPVATFLPTYHWGRSIFWVNGGLVISSAVMFVICLITLIKVPKSIE